MEEGLLKVPKLELAQLKFLLIEEQKCSQKKLSVKSEYKEKLLQSIITASKGFFYKDYV